MSYTMRCMKVKVIGAGSIGNHLTQACRRMGWDVTVTDADPKALARMRDDIYPSRYGSWDESITQFVAGEEPKGGYDIIMIGTPPHVRTRLALDALKEKPRLILLEKPVSFPFDPLLKRFAVSAKKQRVIVLVGYDHAVAPSIDHIAKLLQKNIIGEPLALDVEFREHWQGIFKAHPWLSGPEDSYLGYWEKGGGASGEHSHALHLWQYLARVAGMGVWKKMSAHLKEEKQGKAKFDSVASFTFETDKKKPGRVIQDVITLPTRKWARVQGSKGFVEWICNGHATGDIVRWNDGKSDHEEVFAKNRPDDFYAETLHIRDLLEKRVKAKDSPLSISSGISVVRVLESAWKNRGKSLTIIRK